MIIPKYGYIAVPTALALAGEGITMTYEVSMDYMEWITVTGADSLVRI